MNDQLEHPRKPHSKLATWSLGLTLTGLCSFVLQIAVIIVLAIATDIEFEDDDPFSIVSIILTTFPILCYVVAFVFGFVSLFFRSKRRSRGLVGMLMSGAILLGLLLLGIVLQLIG